MKSIMISIQPQWVEKILNGEKIIEIRKTKPSCDLPCKVYIYCTRGKNSLYEVIKKGEELPYSDGQIAEKHEFITIPKAPIERWGELGKVVAEFTLNKITEHLHNYIDVEDQESYNFKTEDVKNAGFKTDINGLLDFDTFVEDYGKGKPLYAWHIDDLKIYDKPKELNEYVNRDNNYICYQGYDKSIKLKYLTRPPQSWCYVEELDE